MASLYPQSGYGPQYQNNLLKSRGVQSSGFIGPKKPTGSVLGASTSMGSTPMGGGGYSSGTQSLFNNAASVMEQTPDGPDLDSVNSSFAPALEALNMFQSSLQSQLSGQAPLAGEAEMKAQAEGTRGLYQSGLAEKKQAFQGQRQREEGRTQQNVAEQRRMGSEMIQGLQSKFGGSTGTGGFVGELTGRAVLQGISQSRQALQDTMMQINDAEMSTEREVSRQIETLDMNLQAGVQELRNNLMAQIQQVNMQRGELESQKGMKKIDLLNQFRQQKAEVEARNTAFKQQLFMQLEQSRQKAQELKGMAVQEFETLLQNPTFSQYQPSFGMNSQGRVDNVMFQPKEEDSFMEVSGGSTLFDPKTKQPVYTAPKVGEEEGDLF